MQQQFEFVVYNPERNVRYFATRRLGVGGQGGVWAGITESGAHVALKVIWPTHNSQAYWSWYNDQDGHLQCIHQKHVVVSYDQFQAQPEGWYVIVMEPAVRSLDDVINFGQPLAASRVCVIGAQILSALTYLHSINRVHRDVSAKNLLEFPSGVVKLNDFGVSKAAVAAGEATHTFLGNAMYLPPELLGDGRWTHQSDVYQLGLVLTSLLLGRHVIPPNVEAPQMAAMIRDGVPRLAAEGLIAKHGELGRILRHMVCRTERYRFPTAFAVWTALFQEWQRQYAAERASKEAAVRALKTLGAGAGLAFLARTAFRS
ncbi:MAG: serine/threonine protein kinase [Betaproteobacteria bacterium]